jgi:hypothetical protein
LTGLEVPGSAGVPSGLQSGPDVQALLGELCVLVCVGGDTGAPPPVVEVDAAVAVWVTAVVVVVVPGVVAVDVAGAPVVVDAVVDEDLVCLWVLVVVVDELWLDPPHAASRKASTTTAAATTATRAKSPEHGVRCIT